MIKGMDKFKEFFRDFQDQYVLIGGAACDVVFSEANLTFRATKSNDFGDDFIIFNQGVRFSDEIGNDCKNSNGYHQEWTRYDEYGRVYRVTYFGIFDENGTAYSVINSSVGYAKLKIKYDAYGNITGEEYIDEYNKLISEPESGAAIIERQWDVWGNIISETHRDQHGELVAFIDADYAKYEHFYDDNGNWLGSKDYDKDGVLIEY